MFNLEILTNKLNARSNGKNNFSESSTLFKRRDKKTASRLFETAQKNLSDKAEFAFVLIFFIDVDIKIVNGKTD